MSILSDRIRLLREARGWKQAELAEKAGMSQGSISRIEQGSGATGDNERAIAKALETTQAYLSGESDDPLPPRSAEEGEGPPGAALPGWMEAEKRARQASEAPSWAWEKARCATHLRAPSEGVSAEWVLTLVNHFWRNTLPAEARAEDAKALDARTKSLETRKTNETAKRAAKKPPKSIRRAPKPAA